MGLTAWKRDRQKQPKHRRQKKEGQSEQAHRPKSLPTISRFKPACCWDTESQLELQTRGTGKHTLLPTDDLDKENVHEQADALGVSKTCWYMNLRQ